MRRITLSLALLTPMVFGCFTKSAEPTRPARPWPTPPDGSSRRSTRSRRPRRPSPFDSPERFNWHWIPRERKGLPIKELKPEQRALAFGLLDTGLSTKGVIKATTIMSLEEILRVEEHGTGPVRDPELYFVSVFGDPDDQGEWGWRIEGHHLALNYTLQDGRVVSATPFMFGSNPAEVHPGRGKGCGTSPRSRGRRTSCCSRSPRNSASGHRERYRAGRHHHPELGPGAGLRARGDLERQARSRPSSRP